jgi:hypothetical protein
MGASGTEMREAGEAPPVASLASVSLRRSGVTRPPAAAAAPSPVPSGEDRKAVIAWWRALRRGRDLPAVDDLDRAAIAAAWPEAMLLAYDAGGDAVTRATRLSTDAIVPGAIVEYSPMVTEWLLATARRAARSAAPLEEERGFPVGRGLALYRLLALPLGGSRHVVDHVLCRIGVE